MNAPLRRISRFVALLFAALLVSSTVIQFVQAPSIDAKPGSTFSIPVTKDWERHDVYVTALVFRVLVAHAEQHGVDLFPAG